MCHLWDLLKWDNILSSSKMVQLQIAPMNTIIIIYLEQVEPVTHYNDKSSSLLFMKQQPDGQTHGQLSGGSGWTYGAAYNKSVYCTYGIDIPDDDSRVLGAGSQFAAVGGEATVPHLIAVVVQHLQRLTWKLLPTTPEYNTVN